MILDGERTVDRKAVTSELMSFKVSKVSFWPYYFVLAVASTFDFLT